MKMKNFLALFVFTVSSSALYSSAMANDETYLPAAAMVDRALDNYPVYRQATQNIETSRAEAQGLRYGPHELTLQGGYTRRYVDGFGSFGEYDTTLSKGVRIRGKAKLDSETGDLGIEISENIAEDARHQTALLLKQVWMDWLLAAETRAQREESTALFRKALSAIERRRDLSDASDLDVGLARSAVEKAVSELSAAQGEELLAKEMITSMFPEIIPPPRAPKLPAPDRPSDMQNWSQMVVSRSHEVTIAEKQAEQLGVIAQRTKLDKYADPEVGLRLFSERGGEETGFGVQISMPLGVKKRKSLAARDRSKAKAADYAAAFTRREVGMVAIRDVKNVQSAYQTWRAAQTALQSSQYVIEKIRRSYELGAHDYAQLLVAEQQHLESIEAETLARHKAHNAWLQLRIDAHELWLDNIH